MSLYQISFSDTPHSKARYRTALKLMGAQDVTIKEQEAAAATPKPKKDNLPTSPEAKLVASLYKRSFETPWSDKEIDLFRKARTRGIITIDNMNKIWTHYSAERRKEKHFCRHDLLTFLRNVDGELDRANAAKPEPSRKGEWLDSTKKVIPMPIEAEQERIREQAREQAARFRGGLA